MSHDPQPSWQVSPPDGWFTFGSHAGVDFIGRLEFWGEEFSEDGLPIWERPADHLNTVKAERPDEAVEAAWGVLNAYGAAAWIKTHYGQRERDVVREALAAAAATYRTEQGEQA